MLSSVAGPLVRASRSCALEHGIWASSQTGENVTSGADTGVVPLAVGQRSVVISWVTGRNGTASDSTVPSRPNSVASSFSRRSGRRGRLSAAASEGGAESAVA